MLVTTKKLDAITPSMTIWYVYGIVLCASGYATPSSHVHVLRNVNGGSFTIPLYQGSNNIGQSITTGINANFLDCEIAEGALIKTKLLSYL